MSLFPDLPLPAPPAKPKPKLTAEECQTRQAEQLTGIRFRVAIGHQLEDQDITTPAAIGVALGMPPAEAIALLSRKQWREGDLALLEAAADRLGVQVPGPDPQGL
jgi:hypothetical protein